MGKHNKSPSYKMADIKKGLLNSPRANQYVIVDDWLYQLTVISNKK